MLLRWVVQGKTDPASRLTPALARAQHSAGSAGETPSDPSGHLPVRGGSEGSSREAGERVQARSPLQLVARRVSMVSLLDRSAGFERVLCALDDHVATITLNRPERRNALNYRAYDELEQAFRAATADPEVRSVIVTGTDPAFCSGDDVGEIMAGPKPVSRAPMPVTYQATPAALA
eukprot:gene36093-59134_t